MAVYTKKGDTGKTGTMKKQGSKADAVYAVLGTLDELNANIGILQQSKSTVLKKQLIIVQSDLFMLGSWLAGSPFSEKFSTHLSKRVIEFEKIINELDKKNKPIKNFILPGGTFESGFLHVSRTISRRFERQLVLYFDKHKQKGSDELLKYANRLSDYLFILARYYNKKGKSDIVWKI
jgi:cob(I)alamin adenosyltransferase